MRPGRSRASRARTGSRQRSSGSNTPPATGPMSAGSIASAVAPSTTSTVTPHDASASAWWRAASKARRSRYTSNRPVVCTASSGDSQPSHTASLTRPSAAIAGAAPATDRAEQLRVKRAIHRQSAGSADHATDTAPSRRTRSRAAVRSAPGAASGTTWLGTRWPALAIAHPPSTGPRSITVTSTSRSASSRAADRPTIPAPTTSADFGGRATGAVLNADEEAVKWTMWCSAGACPR